MTEKEKAAAGLLYDANNDPTITVERLKCQQLCHEHNMLQPMQIKERELMIRKIVKKIGKRFLIELPFRCDFGYRISIGEDFYANYNLIILDGAEVTIGNNVFIGPDCHMYAASHPLDIHQRNLGLEYALPITIGDNVWIGGNVTILAGVSIGSGTTIGAGSVVNKDMPENVLAAGNPCRIIKDLSK